jgi:very-short-patch-repair endonuclease
MNDWRRVAERQYAAISRDQLREHLTNRQIDHLTANGELERVHPAVFRVAGSYPSARQRAMCALLWCGPEALLSHATAASLLRVPCLPDERVHVAVPETIRRTSAALVLHRRAFDMQDRIEVDGLACTSATRTIIDLAAVLDAEQLEHAFDAARRLGLTSRGSLERRAAQLTRLPRPISTLLLVTSPRPTESRLEVKTARLLREKGFFPPTSQYGVGRYRIDFAWPEKLVGLECDGFEWHGDRLAWKRDRRRVADLEHAGWRLVHWTWDDVTKRSEQAIARLRQALLV